LTNFDGSSNEIHCLEQIVALGEDEVLGPPVHVCAAEERIKVRLRFLEGCARRRRLIATGGAE
jgi:hypothetical protein